MNSREPHSLYPCLTTIANCVLSLFLFTFSIALRQTCSLAGTGRLRQVEEAPRSHSHEGMERSWDVALSLLIGAQSTFQMLDISQKPILPHLPYDSLFAVLGYGTLWIPRYKYVCIHACTHAYIHMHTPDPLLQTPLLLTESPALNLG